MKFLVVTYGTEGDARPLAALCRALMDAGHEALLLADGATLGTAQALGVPAAALAGDIRGALRPDAAISGVVGGGSGAAGTAKALARIADAHAEAWLRAAVEAGRGSDAIILSGLAAFIGLSAAEHLGIPAIGAGLIPITPTAAFPSPFLPPALVPRVLNRASHHLVNAMLWRAFRSATNAARRSVCGLPPRRRGWTSHPMLYGLSPSLLPVPRDWPENARLCGPWVPPAPAWSPPPALADVLATGEPPLYVGFGSMTGFDRAALLSAVIAAVAGRRALFHPGWSGIDAAALPANILPIGDVPHGWLFPRVSLAIHHGGSGTTHSAARAGIPSVVVPFAGDQPFWADRLMRLGVAGRPVPAKRLTAAALAQGIAFAEQPETRGRARALGARMQAEDGLATAVAAIEALMRR
ncbi:glycosyltransferase [Plastoroseomonas hellenica]|uniref:glycosyltransferase n=1 Tax=Plastoroseomonas hellenica TaxID=2687306 RepID=UPI001BAE30EE|nr:glycosyltransferase family 1 protein [Plastoroseomonas hellenica]